MKILAMSFWGSVLILLVMLIRMLGIRRLPKRAFPILWGIALLRLLIPFSIPLPVGILPAGEGNPLHEILPGGALTNLQPFTPMPNQSNSPAPPSTGLSIWTILWIVGAGLCALHYAVIYFRCRWAFRSAVPVENSGAVRWLSGHKLLRPIRIRQSARTKTPLTYGILRPIILMPADTDWSSPQRLCYILAHEWTHIRRFDPVLKLLATAACCLHWFNPLVWILCLFLNRDLELSCDEAVLRAFGHESKKAYALALICMEEQKSGLVSFGNNFSKNAIEERIEAVMKYKKRTIWAAAAAAALAVGLLTGFMTTAGTTPSSVSPISQDGGSPPVQGDGTPTIPQTERSRPVEEPQSVTFDSVDLLYYDNGWPYLHNIFTNHTDKAIASYQYCMLAYDKNGEPLKLTWYLTDSSAQESYACLTEEDLTVQPGASLNREGGWSLYDGEVMDGWPKVGDGGPNKAAYALFQVKEITFHDGSVWENPGFDSWRTAYEGKTTAVEDLKSYYPHTVQVAP